MAIKQLDPRMIDPGKRFTNTDATYISNLTSDNVIATNITIPGGNSSSWNAAFTLVQTNSALWEESADITNIGTVVTSSSANWNQAYNVSTIVQSSSASWEESADILPTITNFLSTSNVTLCSIFVTSLTALSAQFDQTVYTITTSESLTATSALISSLNVTSSLLSAGVDLFNIFLTTETDSQTLVFDESTNQLTILSGNTVSLSSLSDTTIINSVSSLLTPLTVYQNASANWQTTYETVCALSALWEESADILPTITNFLSTELVTVSSLNVTQQLLSGNNDLFNLFLTPANTLTTSVCAMSGDGITPFIMNFTNGLLTSITF